MPDSGVILYRDGSHNGTRGRVELASDGPRVKITQGPPEGEIGSAYSGERMFVTFDDGKVFETKDLRETDFEYMLDHDGKAKTMEQVLTLPLMSADYSIEPGPDDSGEAEFVREELERPANAGGMTTPIDLVIGQMTSAVTLRRAYFEKVFQVVDGRVTFKKIAFRPARTCSLLRDRDDYSFQGFRQRFRKGDGFETKDIPPQKALVYIHGQHRDPLYGISSLRTAYSIFESKQKIRFLWYSFLEGQTIPKAIAKHHTDDPDEQDEFAKQVASLKGGGVVGIGPDQSVEAFESSGKGADVFKQAMDYLSSEMVGSVLAGFTELPSAAASGRGSNALSESQVDFYKLSRLGVLTEMGAVLTSYAVADLVLWNRGVNASFPSFKFKPPAPEAMEQAFELLKTLAQAQQPVAVPQEFIDMLTEKVAGYLGINVDQVRKAIEDRVDQAPDTPVAKIQAGVDAATILVKQAQAANGSQPGAPAVTG